MKRITKEILSRMESTVRKTSVKSITDTFGKALATARCMRADSSPEATRVTSTCIAGASSRAPRGNRTKKFGWIRRHSTERRLATRVLTGTPCTSKTKSFPKPTPRSRAIPSSSETGIAWESLVTLATNVPERSFRRSAGDRYRCCDTRGERPSEDPLCACAAGSKPPDGPRPPSAAS